MIAGTETEYGLLIEGRGASEQVDDARDFVQSYPGRAFVGWDYRFESPRKDLRGFALDRLATDPTDAQFDEGRTYAEPHVLRADRILPNGARFYNDHGHPEYATPECRSVLELARHDGAGESVLLAAAREYTEKTGRRVTIYKNNTDFHGATYGTHESYAVPRELGFDRLFAAVTPILVARTLVCGAGRVGGEQRGTVPYQMSQRADFLERPANAETLFHRPVFNTRDEPHGEPSRWIRLHVISCDANMILSSVSRRTGLVKLALALEEAGAMPPWNLSHPVAAFRAVSHAPEGDPKLDLEGGSWTTAPRILESVLDSAERYLQLTDDLASVVAECRFLLEARTSAPDAFRRKVDWAAKAWLLHQVAESEGIPWGDPLLQSYDLAYHDIHPDTGLFFGMEAMGEVEARPESLEKLIDTPQADTRAAVRGAAVVDSEVPLTTASWGTLTRGEVTVALDPDLDPSRAESSPSKSVH